MLLRKKGIAPVIATVLLIAIVLASASIVFLWFRGFTEEAIIKFDKNIELVCEEVVFSAEYSSGALVISNNGNVPIEDFRLKKIKLGGYDSVDIGMKLGQGGTNRFDVDLTEYNKVALVPILRGTLDGAEENYVCDERFEIEVVVNE